ncbi:MAG: hypothetical protein K2J38_03725 [Muribaculaceae bacterium]|nr:hypothetical protein [Muribaculaceae bacterium]
MSPSLFIVLACIFAVVGLVTMFLPRIPAVLAGYAALVSAHFAGAVFVSGPVLWFWGIATALVLGLRILQPRALVDASQGHWYTVAGSVAGAFAGIAISATQAAVILGGALGAFIGTAAFSRTRAGSVLRQRQGAFLQYLCAKGIPALVCASMSVMALVLASTVL